MSKIVNLSEEDRVLIKRLTAAIENMNKPAAIWITAQKATEFSGLTTMQLRVARQNGSIRWKQGETGGYLYDLHSLPNVKVKADQSLSPAAY